MHQALNIGAEQPVIAPTHVTGPKMDLEVNLADFSSVTLARLVEEVRNEDLPGATKYDRTYNRHNR
ncbi:YhhA family cyclophane-containing RiPP [Paraburkholderia sp. BR13439]|uniref:YhhA family cyclophane-containing RiPP n=1 Tax=Burkholderiaceae TaxID=119060 RepID=UPI00296B4A04|nr:YhhA family cyclophane-containing RiPP [Cupriavidus sp. CV2]MDW3681615.1 YhhA family cyclophane-containing RiPP [Cupriavidus sp. CV2]